MTEPHPGNPELVQSLRREIRRSGAISFARFMERCLYDPDHGYYTRGGSALGRRGDFFTASDVGSGFGDCLARQLGEMDGVLGGPDPFELIEFGAGRGLLARDVLDAVSRENERLMRRIRCTLVDRSPGMRTEAGRRVPEAVVAEPGEAPRTRVGCVLAVELFDALPVRRVRRRHGRLREIVVDLDDASNLVEREADPSEEVRRWVERYGAARGEGDEAEVCGALFDTVDLLESALGRGFLLVVDYGDLATALYGPRHRRGTLLAYHRHTVSHDYLKRVGRQDLTAHVNLSALEERARERGLVLLGRTTQDRFLLANGLTSVFEDVDPDRLQDPVRAKRRLAAMQLIHPLGMGRRFRVLVFSKNVEPAPRLAGLADPFA